jgi:hypothetical protein
VWGRLNPSKIVPKSLGNTPTCVGKTSKVLRVLIIFWKHPHVCGEDKKKTKEKIK